MSKVNSKRAKLVKAKVKVVKAVKTGEVKADEAKVADVKAKVVESIVNAFMYPNKGKYEIDSVKVSLNGKDQTFTALSKAKLDISALKLNDLVKQLFIELREANASKFMFGYKNVYSFAFGIVPLGFNSYKAVIAHHNGDGQRSLVLNANKHFGMTEIEKALVKLSLAYENHKTYDKLYISKENVVKVVKACQSLVEVAKVG